MIMMALNEEDANNTAKWRPFIREVNKHRERLNDYAFVYRRTSALYMVVQVVCCAREESYCITT